MKCRNCEYDLNLKVLDLGTTPPSNAYLTKHELEKPEKYYPLRVFVCTECWLMQTEDFTERETLFDETYSYFSSVSKSFVEHAENFTNMITQKLCLDSNSTVVELASNDGYLLQFFNKKKIRCFGVEPTKSAASEAKKKGVETVESFFGKHLAQELLKKNAKADLIIANNVLAHVPDILDFVEGISILLGEGGVVTIEFPHLMSLINFNQFDTIYHEHFSYLSLTSCINIFGKFGLEIFDVDKLDTHGGSLRLYLKHVQNSAHKITGTVELVLQEEINAGLLTEQYYKNFSSKVIKTKNEFLDFLISETSKGKKIVGYGAAAKANTFINFAGIRSDLIEFIVDKSPQKEGKFMPGSRIPIVSEENLLKLKPEFVIVFPWNLSLEITEQLRYVKKWDGRLMVAIPELKEIFH